MHAETSRRSEDSAPVTLAGVKSCIIAKLDIGTAKPPDAMYMFSYCGMTDNLDYCKKLVTETGPGLASGIAFGSECQGSLRWYFVAGEEYLASGAGRLKRLLQKRRGA